MQHLVNAPPGGPVDEMDDCEVVHGLLERCLAGHELVVPILPEVAVRVVKFPFVRDGASLVPAK